jgi:hypothetical protein
MARRESGFEDVPQDKIELLRDDMPEDAALKSLDKSGLKYPPPTGALRLTIEAIDEYYEMFGSDTLRQKEEAEKDGRPCGKLVYFKPVRTGGHQLWYIFGSVKASMEGYVYRVCASLITVGETAGTSVQAVQCMLGKTTKITAEEKVATGEAAKCVSPRICSHGRALLNRIRDEGLPVPSTDGPRSWGIPAEDGTPNKRSNLEALAVSGVKVVTREIPKVPANLVSIIRTDMREVFSAISAFGKEEAKRRNQPTDDDSPPRLRVCVAEQLLEETQN